MLGKVDTAGVYGLHFSVLIPRIGEEVLALSAFSQTPVRIQIQSLVRDSEQSVAMQTTRLSGQAPGLLQNFDISSIFYFKKSWKFIQAKEMKIVD